VRRYDITARATKLSAHLEHGAGGQASKAGLDSEQDSPVCIPVGKATRGTTHPDRAATGAWTVQMCVPEKWDVWQRSMGYGVMGSKPKCAVPMLRPSESLYRCVR